MSSDDESIYNKIEDEFLLSMYCIWLLITANTTGTKKNKIIYYYLFILCGVSKFNPNP